MSSAGLFKEFYGLTRIAVRLLKENPSILQKSAAAPRLLEKTPAQTLSNSTEVERNAYIKNLRSVPSTYRCSLSGKYSRRWGAGLAFGTGRRRPREQVSHGLRPAHVRANRLAV
ncbi:hypothetical protein TSOC_000307 [Tetrabaena socialis]|uniref:Uncharacterized protein n=1 Tax=Tetrabaena socialis TaxID=47790 RepID=A0A2J8AJU3_9CHLO|nr:hypothetical protein TSOC_000307 [Tetrabaena socialis]|eukprot:PNH12779.1 hypothetical protein TSOC_000307 [Tetrabaena socialis]